MMGRKIRNHAPVMESLAESLGLTYLAEENTGLEKFLGSFKLFKTGGGKKIYNVVKRDRPNTLDVTSIFDYRYVISTGKSTHVFEQTVYMVYSKKFALPHFYMVPEKWYHRFGTIFGIEDIDFVQYPKFSFNYFLKGDDPEFIHHTFDQQTLLAHFGRKTGYSLEGCNYLFILYKHNKILNMNAIQSMIRTGEKVSTAFRLKGLRRYSAQLDLISMSVQTRPLRAC